MGAANAGHALRRRQVDLRPTIKLRDGYKSALVRSQEHIMAIHESWDPKEVLDMLQEDVVDHDEIIKNLVKRVQELEKQLGHSRRPGT